MEDFERFDHLSNTSFDEAVLEDITEFLERKGIKVNA